MKIETERLVIIEFDLSMAEDVHKNSLDEDTRRFVPDEVFETVEEAKETIEFLMSCYETGEGPLVYPMLIKGGANIGYVQLVPIEEGFEVGYHVAKNYRGQGYATEALLALIQFVKTEKNLDLKRNMKGQEIIREKILKLQSIRSYTNQILLEKVKINERLLVHY